MNQVNIIGRLTNNVKLIKSKNGKVRTHFYLNVKRRYADNKLEYVNVHCVAFDKKAELLAKMLKKGSELGIQGHLSSFDYYDNEFKERRKMLDIVVDNFYVIINPKQINQSDLSLTTTDNVTPVEVADLAEEISETKDKQQLDDLD